MGTVWPPPEREAQEYKRVWFGLLGNIVAWILIVILFFHRHRHGHVTADSRKTATRYTVGMGASEAGMYWSGAMRCPKCRSDMEQVDFEGTVIDRCSTCHGIWFDPGELEKLRTRQAASAIDIGNPTKGREQNRIDRYRCPRCGGSMTRLVDPKQKHIWYEKCSSCHGSFFYDGELIDLTTVSASDFVKRFTTPERR